MYWICIKAYHWLSVTLRHGYMLISLLCIALIYNEVLSIKFDNSNYRLSCKIDIISFQISFICLLIAFQFVFPNYRAVSRMNFVKVSSLLLFKQLFTLLIAQIITPTIFQLFQYLLMNERICAKLGNVSKADVSNKSS